MPDRHESATPGGDSLPVVDVFGMTHRGRVRTVNEDQFFAASLRKSMWVRQTSLEDAVPSQRCADSTLELLVVADGLGGMGGGKRASGTAVETLARHISETVGCYFTADVREEQEFMDQLEDAVERAHDQVLALHTEENEGASTTLTMAALVWPRAYIIHVGDTRAYYLRNGRLRQLTRDQTVFEDLVDGGLVQEDQPGRPESRHRLKDVLTSAIGYEIRPSVGLVDLAAGDVLLLCTDGVIKHVSDDEIATILGSAASAEAACRQMIELTLDRGATDNATVLVGRFPAA